MVIQWRGFYSSANRPFLGLSFHFARELFLSKCLWVGTYPTLASYQLVIHQFELLDLRESELTVHESRGFDGSANMTFLGLSFHFAR